MDLKKIIYDRRPLRTAFLLLGGIIMSLSVIFPKRGFISWIGMIPSAAMLMTAARDGTVRLRRMYGYGFLYFFTFYSMGFHWFIAMYPLEFVGGMSRPEALLVVLVATFGLGALQASFSALFGVILALIARGGYGKKHPVLLPVSAALIYPLLEWAQTFTWAGVPWSRLAMSQVESAVMLKSVSLFGSYFLSALIVAVNFLMAEFLLSDNKFRARALTVAAAAVIGGNAAIGGILIAADRDVGREIKAAAIQPNISSTDPWGFDTNENMMELLEKYSLEAADKGAELIVWPETAILTTFEEGYTTYHFACDLAKRCDATIVVGAFLEESGGDKNSLFFISPDGEGSSTVYSKRKLVPFGEFVPMRDFFEAVMPQLVDLLVLGSDLVPSSDSGVVDTDAGRLGGLICFDSIYETLSLDSVRDGAELLVLSTNDSWFIGSQAVNMHTHQARLRAVETGRYIVRSASTGVSMMISPDGEVLDSLSELSGGYASASVRLRDGKTLYSVIGNSFVYLSAALIAGILLSVLVEHINVKSIIRKRK